MCDIKGSTIDQRSVLSPSRAKRLSRENKSNKSPTEEESKEDSISANLNSNPNTNTNTNTNTNNSNHITTNSMPFTISAPSIRIKSKNINSNNSQQTNQTTIKRSSKKIPTLALQDEAFTKDSPLSPMTPAEEPPSYY